jgi:acyl-coenzyme A synthetase/AMP-(fatty) acid ligase
MLLMMTFYSLVLCVIDDNIDEDEPAIYYGSEDDPLIVSHITFGQLKRMSNRVANMLGVTTKTSNCRMLQLYN